MQFTPLPAGDDGQPQPQPQLQPWPAYAPQPWHPSQAPMGYIPQQPPPPPAYLQYHPAGATAQAGGWAPYPAPHAPMMMVPVAVPPMGMDPNAFAHPPYYVMPAYDPNAATTAVAVPPLHHQHHQHHHHHQHQHHAPQHYMSARGGVVGGPDMNTAPSLPTAPPPPAEVRFSAAKQKRRPKPTSLPAPAPGQTECTQLVVFYLALEVTDASLTQLFSKFDGFLFARVVTDPPSGASRGFGYLWFDSQEHAMQAVESSSGRVVLGKRLRVDFANPQTNVPTAGPTAAA